MNISRLQYITQDVPYKTHPQLAEEACIAGVEWIQLRIKNKTQEDWLVIAKEVKQVCEKYKAQLIINDNAQIAKEVKAYGIHLGKDDMPVTEARKLLGEKFIIGATANTFEDILKLVEEKADYIGLGPFRFTTTKEKLSPVLNIEGYKEIMEKCDLHKINIPVIAVGGITSNDVEALLEAGVHGVAISSYITNSTNKVQTIQKFNSQLKSLTNFHNF